MRRLYCLQINSQNQNRNIFGKTKRIGIPNILEFIYMAGVDEKKDSLLAVLFLILYIFTDLCTVHSGILSI